MAEIGLYKTGVTRDGSYDGIILTGDDKSDPVIASRYPEVDLEVGTMGYVTATISTRASSNHTHALGDIADWPSNVSQLEMSYLSNVTSDLNDQFSTKLDVGGGGVVSGNLTMSRNPTNDMEVATKGYADSLFSALDPTKTGYKTGDVLSYPSATPPAGCLRMDGGKVSKLVYSDLYKIIGETFNTGQTPILNTPEPPIQVTGAITNGTMVGSTTITLAGKKTYMFGGTGAGGALDPINAVAYVKTDSVETMKGKFFYSKPLSIPTAYCGCFKTSNRVYVAGGFTGGSWWSASNSSDKIYSIGYDQDGNLVGDWVLENTTLPIVGTNANFEVYGDSVWLIGGRFRKADGSYRALEHVYKANLTNGELSPFTQTIQHHPEAKNNLTSFMIGDTIFMFGSGIELSEYTKNLFYFKITGGVAQPIKKANFTTELPYHHYDFIKIGNRYYIGGGQLVNQTADGVSINNHLSELVLGTDPVTGDNGIVIGYGNIYDFSFGDPIHLVPELLTVAADKSGVAFHYNTYAYGIRVVRVSTINDKFTLPIETGYELQHPGIKRYIKY